MSSIESVSPNKKNTADRLFMKSIGIATLIVLAIIAALVFAVIKWGFLGLLVGIFFTVIGFLALCLIFLAIAWLGQKIYEIFYEDKVERE